MSTSITTHTAESLNALTLATITGINNHFANMVGAKETKRFGTKPAAVKKCLANQAEFNKQFPAKPEPKAKSAEKKSRFDATQEIAPTGHEAKEGTIEHTIQTAISEGSTTAAAIITYVVENYSRPRSEKNVDEAFAIRKIKRLIKKGYLKSNA